ncbi:CDHR4 protein, partial [Turnix velox]|nr:CDHR4 protein [Turnix velox]
QVTLHAGAELNAHQVNQYTLTLRAVCPGEEEVVERLFIRVTAGQMLHCNAPFNRPGGDVVQVSADVAPQTPLYVVLPQPLGGLTVSGDCPRVPQLQNQDTPLLLTQQGLVQAPANGFPPSKDTPRENHMFRLEIEVMDRHGHNCSGTVTVEVLPSQRPSVTFLKRQQAVTVPEDTSPLEVIMQVFATGDNVRYAIFAPAGPVLFTINEVTGEIRSTHRLKVTHTRLLVHAYNSLYPVDHDTATVNITVQGTDQRAPSCVPAIYVSQVPETVSLGSTLVTLRCTNPAGTKDCLHYSLEGPPASLSYFHMQGPQLQVNATLDYDSEAMAAVGFQFTATIVVTAGRQSPWSTRVPVLLTVTPVNEFTPTCPSGADFTVLETAGFGSIVGHVTGSDRDYPPGSLEYSLEGDTGPMQPFSIDTRTGDIRVVGLLDSRQQKSYRLTVRLTDTHNDLDPAKRRSCLCNVVLHLQAVPNQAPVCTPEVQELQILAALGSRQPVTHLACQGSPDNAILAYAIIGGNEDGHFQMEGNTLFQLPSDFTEPRTFVLLVEVQGSPSVLHHSTMVALVVHVTPRIIPVSPSTTTQHMMPQKEPLVITRTEVAWHPPAWFVTVLTVSSALLLATLGCIVWSL